MSRDAGVKHNMWRIVLQQNEVFCFICLSWGQGYTTHCLVWSQDSLVYVSVTNKLFCRTKPAPGLKVNPPVWSLFETCVLLLKSRAPTASRGTSKGVFVVMVGWKVTAVISVKIHILDSAPCLSWVQGFIYVSHTVF